MANRTIKLWVIKRRDSKPLWYNFAGASIMREISSNEYSIPAIHAFFLKREAEAYLKNLYKKHADLFEVVPLIPA